SLRTGGDLEGVCPRHGPVRSDVEERTRAELRRAEVVHVVVDGIQVRPTVIVAKQLHPTVRARVELVIDQDAVERIETGKFGVHGYQSTEMRTESRYRKLRTFVCVRTAT